MILNHKKIIFLILSLFLLTGCTVDYELIITNGVTESVYINNTDIILNQEILNTIKDDYGNYYTIDYNGDIEYCDSEDCEDPHDAKYNYNSFSASTIYNDYSKYRESKAIKDFFGEIKINQNKKLVIIKATPKTQLQNILKDVNYIKAPVNQLNINIVLPFKVTSSNADKVEGDTYTWIYNKDNTDKVLTISYDTNDSNNIVIDNNKENESNKENNQTNNTTQKSNNSVNKYIFLGIVFSVIIIIGIFILKKMRSNNNV